MHIEHPALALGAPDPACDELVVYPIETPLYGSVDTESGHLTLETMVQHRAGAKSLTRVRLNFSPDATHRFIDLLRALENQFGMNLGRGLPPMSH